MAYDEKLAARVRTLLSDRSDVTERRMFGGLTFLVGRHMCCGVQSDELVLRLGPEGAEEQAKSSSAALPRDAPAQSSRHGEPAFLALTGWQLSREPMRKDVAGVRPSIRAPGFGELGAAPELP